MDIISHYVHLAEVQGMIGQEWDAVHGSNNWFSCWIQVLLFSKMYTYNEHLERGAEGFLIVYLVTIESHSPF